MFLFSGSVFYCKEEFIRQLLSKVADADRLFTRLVIELFCKCHLLGIALTGDITELPQLLHSDEKSPIGSQLSVKLLP